MTQSAFGIFLKTIVTIASSLNSGKFLLTKINKQRIQILNPDKKKENTVRQL